MTPEIGAAVQRLRIDYATAEVLRAFDAAGIQSILLKGASIVRWLYDDAPPPRGYVDCDLLVRPADAEGATHVLAGLGFAPELEEAEMPEWWREHGVEWLRSDDGAVVDLHRTIPGVQVDPERLWATLSERTETVLVGGFPARVLAIPGRALHLALHAAQHGWRHRAAELERAVDHADEGTWRDAAELAESLGATAAFATGLRFVPAGAGLAARLGLPSERPVDVALRAGGAPPEALTFERLSRARGLRARISILRHKLAPPRTYMRKWSPRARRGRLGLAAAYARRPFWILRRTPQALRAWREARGEAGREAARSVLAMTGEARSWEPASALPRRDPAVLDVEIDGERVLYHPGKWSTLRLDSAGSVLWTALDGEGTVAGFAADVADAFSIDSDEALAGVLALLERLDRAQFLACAEHRSTTDTQPPAAHVVDPPSP